MKSYKQVVKERYDGSEKKQEFDKDIYSIINPIGFNGYINMEGVIYKIFRFLLNKNIDITSIKVLDVGCGSGTITRLLSEFTGNSNNILGIDLSEHRIKIARTISQNINYKSGDIVNSFNFDDRFDLITAFDVLMHLHTKELLDDALNNIYQNLNPNGFFIWYDTYAKDHFKCSEDAECNGFNSKQMDALAKKQVLKKYMNFLYIRIFSVKGTPYIYIINYL